MKTQQKFFYFYCLFGASFCLFIGLYSVMAFSEGKFIYAVSAPLNFMVMFNLLFIACDTRRQTDED